MEGLTWLTTTKLNYLQYVHIPRWVVPQDAKTTATSQGARRNQGLPALQNAKAGGMEGPLVSACQTQGWPSFPWLIGGPETECVSIDYIVAADIE